MIRSTLAAFSIYSRLPVPRIAWDEQSLQNALCAFPAVGLALGAFMAFWFFLCRHFAFDPIVRAAGATLLPIFLTGGIHLDGFMDTQDALASNQDKARKLEILKDPHAGAFSVISLCAHLLMTFALFVALKDARAATGLCVGFVVSRALSALAAACFRSARQGMLSAVRDASKTRALVLSAAVWLALSLALASFLSPVLALCLAFSAALAFFSYRFTAYRAFGGVTGDLAGWFLQRCELFILIAMVLYGRFL